MDPIFVDFRTDRRQIA